MTDPVSRSYFYPNTFREYVTSAEGLRSRVYLLLLITVVCVVTGVLNPAMANGVIPFIALIGWVAFFVGQYSNFRIFYPKRGKVSTFNDMVLDSDVTVESPNVSVSYYGMQDGIRYEMRDGEWVRVDAAPVAGVYGAYNTRALTAADYAPFADGFMIPKIENDCTDVGMLDATDRIDAWAESRKLADDDTDNDAFLRRLGSKVTGLMVFDEEDEDDALLRRLESKVPERKSRLYSGDVDAFMSGYEVPKSRPGVRMTLDELASVPVPAVVARPTPVVSTRDYLATQLRESMKAAVLAAGIDLDEEPKKPTLCSSVLLALSDGGWWTLRDLSTRTGSPEASVSARLRDLRKPQFGGHTIERRSVGDGSRQFRYRLVK